jgi:hypothetical protein
MVKLSKKSRYSFSTNTFIQRSPTSAATTLPVPGSQTEGSYELPHTSATVFSNGGESSASDGYPASNPVPATIDPTAESAGGTRSIVLPIESTLNQSTLPGSEQASSRQGPGPQARQRERRHVAESWRRTALDYFARSQRYDGPFMSIVAPGDNPQVLRSSRKDQFDFCNAFLRELTRHREGILQGLFEKNCLAQAVEEATPEGSHSSRGNPTGDSETEERSLSGGLLGSEARRKAWAKAESEYEFEIFKWKEHRSTL